LSGSNHKQNSLIGQSLSRDLQQPIRFLILITVQKTNDIGS